MEPMRACGNDGLQAAAACSREGSATQERHALREPPGTAEAS
eukprot:CAMPEP_0197883900 /NCGR_PEP_ID=MMETSP1439-20131203/10558_1 /TAXON_ID=66791 /ORGANISM="Gonyaulax spinifera, Strain CCMP409" /LENGTH=41 /DNA_ID= /DNA_START= /DNA_END= /DNA_ORIENTATION=